MDAIPITDRPARPRDAAVEQPAPTAQSWNCLSVDVEEYFHCEAFAAAVRPEQWPGFERRAGPRLEQIAELLDRYESRATFFVLGWMVKHTGGLLRRLAAAGHEIGCHGYGHQHLARMTPRTLAEDLQRAKGEIEDCIGRRVHGYRAPTFSVVARTAWALDVIAAAGFEYDASIFPIRHDRYGLPVAPVGPFWAVAPGGARLLEFPPLTFNLWAARIPLGGGGYMRLLPGAWLRAAVRRRVRRNRPVMLYVHPWELDPQQPEMPAGRLARWRHRVNLGTTAAKVERLLQAFRFDAAQRVLQSYTTVHKLPVYTVPSAASGVAVSSNVR